MYLFPPFEYRRGSSRKTKVNTERCGRDRSRCSRHVASATFRAVFRPSRRRIILLCFGVPESKKQRLGHPIDPVFAEAERFPAMRCASTAMKIGSRSWSRRASGRPGRRSSSTLGPDPPLQVARGLCRVASCSLTSRCPSVHEDPRRRVSTAGFTTEIGPADTWLPPFAG